MDSDSEQQLVEKNPQNASSLIKTLSKQNDPSPPKKVLWLKKIRPVKQW